MSMTSPQTLPMYFPTDFVLEEAVTCASLVLAAYDQYNQWVAQGSPAQANFSWTPDLPGLSHGDALWGTVSLPVFGEYPEPFGFVAWDGGGNAFIVLRGTMSKADAIIDAEVDQTPYTLAPGFGNVQVGWNKVYATISPALLGQIGQLGTVNRLFFTGHSMGSALSTLAVPDVANNSAIKPGNGRSYVQYNFASPSVGDHGFADAMNWNSQTPTFRVVNTEDVVPDVPTAADILSSPYQHIGTPVDFTAAYFTVDGNHSMADCYWYAINHTDAPQGPVPMATLTKPARFDGVVSAAAPRTAKM
jgi:hypothetical protein